MSRKSALGIGRSPLSLSYSLTNSLGIPARLADSLSSASSPSESPYGPFLPCVSASKRPAASRASVVGLPRALAGSSESDEMSRSICRCRASCPVGRCFRSSRRPSSSEDSDVDRTTRLRPARLGRRIGPESDPGGPGDAGGSSVARSAPPSRCDPAATPARRLGSPTGRRPLVPAPSPGPVSTPGDETLRAAKSGTSSSSSSIGGRAGSRGAAGRRLALRGCGFAGRSARCAAASALFVAKLGLTGVRERALLPHVSGRSRSLSSSSLLSLLSLTST